MERYSDKATEIINALHTERLEYNSEYLPLIEAVTRLAAYEDTGLEPEVVAKYAKYEHDAKALLSDMNALAAYRFAETDGRLVVLPCNVGDTVWIVGKVRGVYSARVRTFFCGHPARWGEVDTNRLQMIRTTECDIPIKEFGKTVFLTREEAEAAQC